MGRKDVTVVDVLRIAGVLLLVAAASSVMFDYRNQKKPPHVSDVVKTLPAPAAAREDALRGAEGDAQRNVAPDALRTSAEAVRDALRTAEEIPAPAVRELLSIDPSEWAFSQPGLRPAPFGATSEEDFEEAVHLILETGIAEGRGTLAESTALSSAEYWSIVASYVRRSASCRALDWAAMFLGSLVRQGRVFNLEERPIRFDSAPLVSALGPVPAHYRDSSARFWTLPAWTETPDANAMESWPAEPTISSSLQLPRGDCSDQLGALLVARLDAELAEVAEGKATLPFVSISGPEPASVELTLNDVSRSLEERAAVMTDPDEIVASAFVDLKGIGGAGVSDSELLDGMVSVIPQMGLSQDKVLLLTNAVLRLRAELGGTVQVMPVE
jgi:hypothetical protein